MYPIIFDGKSFAQKKLDNLKLEVGKLKAKNIIPRLAVFLVGDDPASKLYVSLKKAKAEQIGINVIVYKFGQNTNADDLINHIKDANLDSTIHGILIQLPLPQKISDQKLNILNSIDPQKDVDGLRVDSKFTSAAALAVVNIVKYAQTKTRFGKIASVVGSKGTVGKAVTRELIKLSYDVHEIDINDNLNQISDSDLVVSATGNPGLIKGNHIKWDAVVIDLASPKPDFDFKSVKNKAQFITPVPGGVGPVTIACLLENLIQSILT